MRLRKELIFKQIPLFATLSEAELGVLAARAIEKRYAPGAVLFSEGELRLRHLVHIVESVTFGSVRQRLAAALLDFHRQAGADRFRLPVTHEELAARLGTVREVISRNLSRFQAAGLLRVERRRLVVRDRAALEREAQTEL